MIVKCKKFISYVTKEELNSSRTLALNKEYVVLALEVDPRVGLLVIIQSEDYHEPARISLDGFEIVSQHIPSSWVSKVFWPNCYHLLPKSWTYDNFFGELEDEEPEALELFIREAQIIYQEEGRVFTWEEMGV